MRLARVISQGGRSFTPSNNHRLGYYFHAALGCLQAIMLAHAQLHKKHCKEIHAFPLAWVYFAASPRSINVRDGTNRGIKTPTTTTQPHARKISLMPFAATGAERALVTPKTSVQECRRDLCNCFLTPANHAITNHPSLGAPHVPLLSLPLSSLADGT
ncbi:hypothetical protein Q7P37_006373 [Cladosporium fusiforme]